LQEEVRKKGHSHRESTTEFILSWTVEVLPKDHKKKSVRFVHGKERNNAMKKV
jgi:hypothetical protein